MLDCLAGRKKLSSGQLSWAGSSLSSREIAASGSYVEQHDALLGTLTVDETLWYSARLR